MGGGVEGGVRELKSMSVGVTMLSVRVDGNGCE